MFATVFFCVAGTVALTTSAHAYLDPGTASILLQGIVAGAAAVVGTISIYWNRCKGLFAGLFAGLNKKTK